MSKSKENVASIKKWMKNEEVKRQVIEWLMEKEWEAVNSYQKCNECESIGLRETFHGRKCAECMKAYKQKYYQNAKPQKGRN